MTPTASPTTDPVRSATSSDSAGGRHGDSGKQLATGKIKITDVSLVAKVRGSRIGVYARAGATRPALTMSNPLPSGAPLVFLVQERRSDWLRVLLPVRPNQSQGWVRAADVSLSEHSYRIAVSTGKHELRLYRAGKLLVREPVGLGSGATPTPGGVFYIKELLRPGNPSGPYGPYAFGLSGYSKVLEDFAGGSGEIGIHGTNQPGSVGGDVSHGCIRLRNSAITRLAGMLPLGVPVQIVA